MDNNINGTVSRKRLIIGTLVVTAGVAWYAFRPERIFINTRVDEGFPGGVALAQSQSDTAPRVLLSGNFHDGAHKTSGSATIHELAGGNRLLRLTKFETSNGPDVQVYLVAADDARDDATVKSAGFINLGALKGNIGDQNYDIPARVDLEKYRAVTIWCQRFGVNFGTAPLTRETSSAAAASNSPRMLASGPFHDVAHEGKGVASLFVLPDGKRVLRFTDFSTSNGPDVRVYLVAADDATDSETVKQAGFVEVGPLKGNQGNQNYDLPENLDVSKYRAVTIWCNRFGVNFATAPLTASRG
jgi:hypothetical protein